MMVICMDANFRLKNQIVSNYSQDPGLGIGWAYLLPRQAYESYVLSRASDDDVRVVSSLASHVTYLSQDQYMCWIPGLGKSKHEVFSWS